MPNEFTPRDVMQRAFPGILDSEAEEMITAGKVRDYPVGTTLCHEGAVEYVFYIILSGDVEVTKVINESEVRLLKHLRPGDFFGEMAIIHNAPRAATITTTCPTSVLEISKEVFSDLMEHSNSMSLALVREVSRRLRQNDEMAIEDLRLKAKELADAYQQLAEQDFARREFLTTIAHELRTPLMAANGFMQIARTGMLPPEAQQSALETVARNLGDISALVNDILFLQEMDLILPEFVPTDLGAVVAACVEQMRTKAEQTGVRLNVSIASSLPAVAADSKSVSRAINALLDNAVKFSPDGGLVEIVVDSSKNEAYVKIQDHGVGIPPEALPHIFDRFFHMDQVNGYLFRGVGLGLSIARGVIEAHRGHINVESSLSEGSTFTIDLPIQR